MLDDAGMAALHRIRALRRDSYRCRFHIHHGGECGNPAKRAGHRPDDGEWVALCDRHAKEVRRHDARSRHR